MGRLSVDWNSDSKKNSVYVSDYISLILLFAALLLGLAVFSFNPKDATQFNNVLTSLSSSAPTYFNILGSFGAHSADWFIQFFGIGAHMFCAVAMVHALQLFQRPRPRSRWRLRIFGYPQMALCLLGLLTSFHSEVMLGDVGFPVGGLIGHSVLTALSPIFGATGTPLILLFGFFASLPLCLGVNPVTAVLWMMGKLPWSRLSDYAKDLLEEKRTALAAATSRKISPDIEITPECDITVGANAQSSVGERNSQSVSQSSSSSATETKRVRQELQYQPVQAPVGQRGNLTKTSEASGDVPVGVTDTIYAELLQMLPQPQSLASDDVTMQKSLEAQAHLLATKLGTFGVTGRVVRSQPGPVVNVHEFEPAAGIKVTKVLSLQDDLALGLKAQSVLMAPQPGKSTIGIEVPASVRETVALREVMECSHLRSLATPLPMALGKNVDGSPLVADLSAMPHLLIAGATGSGKSVGINVTLLSLMMSRTPEQVRFILVDPKMLELSNYDGIGHLLMPVVTDPSKAAGALKWAIDEMEQRYQLMRKAAVRNIAAFNGEVLAGRLTAEQLDGETPQALPFIVVVIDELCDLMMTAPRDIEDSIQRLAQKARAAGIHLVLATQRPSVDVITGVIKANLPCRISFQVASRHDSRTIIESVGAERLLGRGDMLFLPPGTNKIVRGHGAYIGDREINALSERLKQLYPAQYDAAMMEAVQRNAQSISQKNDSGKSDDLASDGNQLDENDLYDRAVDFAVSSGTVSTSSLQRNFRIGYNRAARLMDRMVKDGLVGPSDVAGKPRQVLSERGLQI